MSRWEVWMDSEETKRLLWRAKGLLKTAWEWDRRHPSSYPINTAYAIAEIQSGLSKRSRNARARVSMPKPKEPKNLAELFPERLVKTVWEEQHSGTFKDAIKQAARIGHDEKKSWKAFQGIIRAIETTYLASYISLELLRRPKVNILHRGLDRIARAAGLGDQTSEGFSEFLDDLCPCGLRRHAEALRKLSSRSPQVRRARV